MEVYVFEEFASGGVFLFTSVEERDKFIKDVKVWQVEQGYDLYPEDYATYKTEVYTSAQKAFRDYSE
jgi:hypothetical protein